ncbi:chorismate mutase [Plectosphaerella plurivora]|uniref:Chorismate mutase n=1 Tax=Plectosphaerella plurivora TaxID=936078 RepID=A0A9P9ABB0_9PEZI|nr:chorismate mutase [Plectosphaerella plurivora]
MDAIIDLNDASKALDLDRIRYQLIRLEDTITFHLIERAQFPLNKPIYIPGALSIPDTNLSFMNWYLREQEKLQSLIRRYESPDEYPFFPDAVQKSILRPLNYPRILHPNDVDVNDKIRAFYVDSFLPAVCADFGRSEDRGESQENYGSSATCDIACLQALSRRIHFGKFVAESKFLSERARFVALIKAEDRAGIDAAITNAAVEKKVLERLRLKVMTYGTDPSVGPAGVPEGRPKIDADAVVAMYKDFVIPLTKEVEVEYLMQRLEESDM